MSDDRLKPGREDDHGLATEEARPIVKRPPLYRVILLNDDYTPMEFVVLVLQRFFGKPHDLAVQVMLKVHHEGRGVCGVYPYDIAHTKVVQVCRFAREQQHPLQCVMEEA